MLGLTCPPAVTHVGTCVLQLIHLNKCQDFEVKQAEVKVLALLFPPSTSVGHFLDLSRPHDASHKALL